MKQLNDLGAPLAEGGEPTSHGSFVLSDGHDVVAYADARGKHPFFRIRRVPPHERFVLVGTQLVVDVSSPYDVSRTMTIVSRTRSPTKRVGSRSRVAR
ncbi:MAG: class II glutamine amidotransferase [Sandaracinus sp.]|nr:class II glutamine amidotransferase [Sandaracinus sp.]